MANKIPVGIIVPNQKIQAEALNMASTGALFRRKDTLSEGLLQPKRPAREDFIACLIKEELAKPEPEPVKEQREPTPKPIALNILFSLSEEELDLAS
jgi:hypothetical protein